MWSASTLPERHMQELSSWIHAWVSIKNVKKEGAGPERGACSRMHIIHKEIVLNASSARPSEGRSQESTDSEVYEHGRRCPRATTWAVAVHRQLPAKNAVLLN